MPKRGRYFRCTDMSSLRVKIGLEVVVQNVFDTDEVPTISAKTIFIKLFARCRMTKLSSLETIAVLIFCKNNKKFLFTKSYDDCRGYIYTLLMRELSPKCRAVAV